MEQLLENDDAPTPGNTSSDDTPHTPPVTTAAQPAEGTFGLSPSKASAHQHNHDVEQLPESDDALTPGNTTFDEVAHILGDTTFDIYLNDRAYWRNIPAAVWNYKLGGYQVLKKWLSYHDHKVLQRPLHPEEVQHFTNTARRITAILHLVNEN